MSTAEGGAAAARVRGSAVAVTGAAEATPSRSVDPAVAVAQVAANSSPSRPSNADKASAVAGLLERWPSSAAALLAQTMACPDVSTNTSAQAEKVSVAGPLHGCAQSDLGVSPSMLNLLQSGAFMHAHPPSLLSAPQGQGAAAALMSQGCTPGSLSATDTATVPAQLSGFPGSDFWGVSALSTTSPPFLTNAAAASLLTAANVDNTGLGCCFPGKLPSAPAREQPQRGRVPQQRQQQQQQPLGPTQHVQHPAGCSPQEQHLLSISPILMMMPPGGSAPEASAPGGRVMGGAGEEPQPSTGSIPGGASAAVSRETLPKVVGVRYDKVNKTWRASWYDPQSKRRVERKFSVNKLGFINAYNLATECRKLQEKKLGLRDRSGRKQNQQHSESSATSAAMQQMSSPTARAALTGAAFPRFDLHPSSAAAAAWEATASTVSPHMDLSLLGPSLKAFTSSNASNSSSSSSLSITGAQAAALLPMGSLLSLTDQQQQLQHQHHLQHPHQLQQQHMRQQTCLQPLTETGLEGQQLQHLGACSDPTSATPTRAASESGYLTQSIASAADAERRAEKGPASAAMLGGATVLSGPLSVLSPHFFDLSTSRQQQQQQRSGDPYAAHPTAALRRSFQAFDGEIPFIPSSGSGSSGLAQRSYHQDASTRQARTLYYCTEGHVSTVKTPAESPSTPHATAVPSEGAAACATPISGRRGNGERTAPAPATEFKDISVDTHKEGKSFSEENVREGRLLVKAATHQPLCEDRVSKGEKRRLEQQTTPQQQRKTSARLTAGSTHSPSGTPECPAVSQQHEKTRRVSQGQQSKEGEVQQQAGVQPYDKAVTNAAPEGRLSISFGTAVLHAEDQRQSIKHQEECCLPRSATHVGPSDSFAAAFSPSAVLPPSVHSSEALAYKLPSRRSDSTAKSRRSTPRDSISYETTASGGSRTAASDPHEGNWAPQDETSACRGRREMLVADSDARETAPLTKYSCTGCPDGHLQLQQRQGVELPASVAVDEAANVESLPSPVENPQGSAAAKNGRNSRTLRLSPDDKKAVCTRQLRAATQQCLAGELQRATVGRDTPMRNDDDAACGAGTQTKTGYHESQQCVKANDPSSRQPAFCASAVLRSQERGGDVQTREEGAPPSGVMTAGLQQSYAGIAAAPPPRRKKQEALLSAASFFFPSSPLGGSPFSLAAYAVTAAAGTNGANGCIERQEGLFSNVFTEDRLRYGQRGMFAPVCGSTAECSCGHICPVLQEAGSGGAALVTRCRGGWCGCRAGCGYKSAFWQKSSRRGWQQLSELKNEKRGQPTCGTLSIVSRTEAKRFASLRLPRQLHRVQHPSNGENCRGDEELHATKWHGGDCWLPEGASASGEDVDVSPSGQNDCNKASRSAAATGEACNYSDAAVGREVNTLRKGEESLQRQNGSKEVLGLVKELLLLLLQSLREALSSLCKRRGATDHQQRETDALADRIGDNEKQAHGWEDRQSKTSSLSCTPSSEVADSSSNSSTCDSDGPTTEMSSCDGSSPMTSREALECAAAVERHTHHVRSAGEIDQLAVYTNLFQACIRSRLVPTELPPLQLMHLLRQLMKAQFTEVNGSRHLLNGRKNTENTSSRSQSTATDVREMKESSTEKGDEPFASLNKTAANSLVQGDPLREDVYALPKAPLIYADTPLEAADNLQNGEDEQESLTTTPYAGHSTGASASHGERSASERLLKGNKEDALATVYERTQVPAAEEESNTARRTTVTARPSHERCAGFRKLSGLREAKKTSVSPDLRGRACLRIDASHSEGPSGQENCSQKSTECALAGEATESSEEVTARTDQTYDKNAARNNLRNCSRLRMQPVHEHYTRSRSDLQKKGRGDCSSGERDRSAEEPAGELRVVDAAVGSKFDNVRAAGADDEGLRSADAQQHLEPRVDAAGAVCTIRQRRLGTEHCSIAPSSSDANLAQQSVPDTSRSLSERKETESRLALLASEIVEDHDETLILQRGPQWTSAAREDTGDAKAVADGLANKLEEGPAARHLLCKGVGGDDAVSREKHEKPHSASRDHATVLEVQSPSASVKARPSVEVLRRSSRRSRLQGALAARITAAPPTSLNVRASATCDEGIADEDVKNVELEDESSTLITEHSAVQADSSGDAAPEEHRKSQSTLTEKERTRCTVEDCRGRVGEEETADDDESNTRKFFCSNSYGVATRRKEDALKNLLL